jgi:hypothetical protein
MSATKTPNDLNKHNQFFGFKYTRRNQKAVNKKEPTATAPTPAPTLLSTPDSTIATTKPPIVVINSTPTKNTGIQKRIFLKENKNSSTTHSNKNKVSNDKLSNEQKHELNSNTNDVIPKTQIINHDIMTNENQSELLRKLINDHKNEVNGCIKDYSQLEKAFIESVESGDTKSREEIETMGDNFLTNLRKYCHPENKSNDLQNIEYVDDFETDFDNDDSESDDDKYVKGGRIRRRKQLQTRPSNPKE